MSLKEDLGKALRWGMPMGQLWTSEQEWCPQYGDQNQGKLDTGLKGAGSAAGMGGTQLE